MTPINLVSKKFETLRTKKPSEQYNYSHFSAKVLFEDGLRTFRAAGICAGEIAPDFQLPQAGGGSVRLSDLRGRPVLLHFGSFTPDRSRRARSSPCESFLKIGKTRFSSSTC